MKHRILLLLAILAVSQFFYSCKKDEASGDAKIAYKDGMYQAVSSVKDDWGGEARLEMEVKDGKIVSCTFISYDEAGKVKDAEYGKQDGEIKNLGLYKIAQNAVSQSARYAELLVETQDLDAIDALSGATVSFALFKDAAMQIMKDAKITEEAIKMIDLSECRT